jgi:hypothetical protein
MVFCLAAGAVAEVVVPLGLAKAGCLSGCTVLLGIVAATEDIPFTYIHYIFLVTDPGTVALQYGTVAIFYPTVL